MVVQFLNSITHSAPRIYKSEKLNLLSLLTRHNFEKTYNAMTGEEEGGDVAFPEFVDLVLNGHIDFADFLEENGLGSSSSGSGGGGVGSSSSAAIDTGMIDGVSGTSRAWNPYWRSCGVCHPDFMPHFILHLDHFKEDSSVSTI